MPRTSRYIPQIIYPALQRHFDVDIAASRYVRITVITERGDKEARVFDLHLLHLSGVSNALASKRFAF